MLRKITPLFLVIAIAPAIAHYDGDPSQDRHFYRYEHDTASKSTASKAESSAVTYANNYMGSGWTSCTTSEIDPVDEIWRFTRGWNCPSGQLLDAYEEHCDYDEHFVDGGDTDGGVSDDGSCVGRGDVCGIIMGNSYVIVTHVDQVSEVYDGFNAPVTGIDAPFQPGCSYHLAGTLPVNGQADLVQVTLTATGDVTIDEVGLPYAIDDSFAFGPCIPHEYDSSTAALVTDHGQTDCEMNPGGGGEGGSGDNSDVVAAIEQQTDDLSEDYEDPSLGADIIGDVTVQTTMDGVEGDVLDDSGETIDSYIGDLQTEVASALPGEQACVDLTYDFAGLTIEFLCDDYAWLRDLLAWFLYVSTAIYIYRLATAPASETA